MLLALAAALAALAAPALAGSPVPGQFSAVDMLTTPRPHAALAAPGGQYALNVVDQWDEESDVTTRTVYLLHPHDRDAHPEPLFSGRTSEAAEVLWLSNETVAYLNGSALYHFSVAPDSSKRVIHLLDFPEGIEPSAIQYNTESRTLAFSGAVWTENLDFEQTAAGDKAYANRGDTGQVYDDLFVRHWDTWRVPGRVYTIGTTVLRRRSDRSFESDHEFTNILNGTGLYSQADAIAADQFSLSPTHIAFALKPPHLQIATHTRLDVHLQPLDQPGSRPIQLTPGEHGAISGVEFSPDGKKIAWLEMAQDGYESDRRVVVVHTLSGSKFGSSVRWTQEWDRSPSDITWALNSESLYVLAEYNGRVRPYHLSTPGRLPTPIAFRGSTAAISPIDDDDSLFILSVSSLVSPIEVYLLDLVEGGVSGDPDKQPPEAVHRLTDYSGAHINGRLDSFHGQELWFTGVDDRKVMAWVIKPRGWTEEDADKSYPLAFFIHGGPQGAWNDAWSTRWNLALYASAGYFVVAVNPTGSTGYGQEFTDRIAGHWGDRPYQDLVAGYFAALDKYPEIDPNRTTALGASYGGYMINWINGHNVFGFKALVYHDGILSTVDTYYSTEEVWFPNHDFQGTLIDNRANYEKWSPLNHVAEWNTPQLVIQGGQDFRLAESQAIGTFTALQLQGVPSRFLYFHDENHWVLKPTNSRRWHHEVLRWLDEWVGAGKRHVDPEAEATEVEGDVSGLFYDDFSDIVGGAEAFVEDVAASVVEGVEELVEMVL
ncbi:Dipeptidyl-peptidase 5 [Vanrija albida]|uniref:Dipeptidyl-peptidase V n=1 Tax=Vanrija albida TaxID=181172 RepID=A0ABR3QA41_9TREE